MLKHHSAASPSWLAIQLLKVNQTDTVTIKKQVDFVLLIKTSAKME